MNLQSKSKLGAKDIMKRIVVIFAKNCKSYKTLIVV